ncbi:MAG: PEP-CTERM sorting domain-containing protein [Leptospirales bacterium]
MIKMKKMKKATLAAGLTLALSLGLSAHVPSAWADYLTAPTQVASGTSGSFVATYATTGTFPNNSFALSYVGNSTFGNTLPVISSIPVPAGYGNIKTITDGGTGSPLPLSDVFYNGSTLALTQIASTGAENYSDNVPGVGSVSGQIISNVLKVGAGSTMAGATPGELVFTYQFDVTSISPAGSGISMNQATVALFNNPGGSQLYTLGSGVNVDSAGNQVPLGTTLSCPGCTTATLTDLAGNVNINAGNGTVASLSDQFANGLTTGFISPEIFVASNALYYGSGSMSVSGSGLTANDPVFVPDTPEPSTLLLLGSGLALLTFMTLRKKEHRLTI